MNAWIALAVLSIVVPIYSLPYSKDSGVIALTKANFADQVFGSEYIWVVEFYAPWCGHCKQLAPEYEKLAKNLKGIVKIGAVNGDDERELAGAYGVKGFPTIKIFPSQAKKSPDGKGFIKEPEDYQGARTAAAIGNAAVAKLPNFVHKVNSKSFDEYLAGEADQAKVILFTNKKETSNLYKGLAIEFHHRLSFAEVRDTDTELVSKYGVTKFPTLFVQTKEGEKTQFKESLGFDTLFKFLTPFAKELPKKETPKSAQKEKTPPKPVRNVREEVKDQKTFETLCYGSSASCLIAFMNPQNTEKEEQENYFRIFEEISKEFSNTVTPLWIDGINHPEFEEKWNLGSGYPAVVIFNEKKSSIVPYIGAFSREALTDFLKKYSSNQKRGQAIKTVPKMSIVKDEL